MIIKVTQSALDITLNLSMSSSWNVLLCALLYIILLAVLQSIYMLEPMKFLYGELTLVGQCPGTYSRRVRSL